MNELPESPATLTLIALWILLFVMMQVRQGSFETSRNPFAFGAIEVTTTHQFGDATSAELVAGQVWRAVTSTFIHYSLLHLLLNLFCLVQLGTIVEKWYGSPQFLIIYLIIGGVGNLFAGLARPWFGISEYAHSGGGSTVVFGLIGLCAVVGWRSKTSAGLDLFLQMFVFLILNLVLGLAFWAFNEAMGMRLPNFDNLAHLGGTVAGASIGLVHRTLRRHCEPLTERITALAGALFLIACTAAQAQANRAEIEADEQRAVALEHWQNAGARVADLARIEQLYIAAYYRGRSRLMVTDPAVISFSGPRGSVSVPLPEATELQRDIKATLQRLESAKDVLGNGPIAPAYRRLLRLATQAIDEPPTRLRVQEFQTQLAIVFQRAQQELQTARTRIVEMTQRARRR